MKSRESEPFHSLSKRPFSFVQLPDAPRSHGTKWRDHGCAHLTARHCCRSLPGGAGALLAPHRGEMSRRCVIAAETPRRTLDGRWHRGAPPRGEWEPPGQLPMPLLRACAAALSLALRPEPRVSGSPYAAQEPSRSYDAERSHQPPSLPPSGHPPPPPPPPRSRRCSSSRSEQLG